MIFHVVLLPSTVLIGGLFHVQMIMERKFQPVVIFSFSRRECEQHAMSMSKLDFNTQEEKEAIEQVFRNAILCLNEEDRTLPAIELMPLFAQRKSSRIFKLLLKALIKAYPF